VTRMDGRVMSHRIHASPLHTVFERAPAHTANSADANARSPVQIYKGGRRKISSANLGKNALR